MSKEIPVTGSDWPAIVDDADYRKQWLAIRKEAAAKIDPETALVRWEYGQVLDPYGLYELTDEEDCIGRNYFARSPESEVWASFGDLPENIRDALWEKHKSW